jgi:hypothetical protein
VFAEESAQHIVIGKNDLFQIGGLALFFQESILPRPLTPPGVRSIRDFRSFLSLETMRKSPYKPYRSRQSG